MMDTNNLLITDRRMIDVMQTLINARRIRFRAEFLRTIEMKNQNYRQVTLGKQSFTIEQILKAVNKYKINPNFLFGISDKMFI